MTGGRVVVLGPTGRNFARRHVAAASPTCSTRQGDFPDRVNKQMVGIEPLEDADEIAEVRAMIERHLEYTGSARAKHAAR